MQYLGPWKNRLSPWIVVFNSVWQLYVLPMDFYMRIAIQLSLEMVDIYDFVRPPLVSHEDMNHMSDDWS